MTLCADCESSPYQQGATSDAVGRWGPIEQVFGGFVGSDTMIRLEITADGMQPYTYQAIYEDTNDPTRGELYLNIRMKPT